MILITGGTGTSGVPIARALLDRGQRVRVLARDPQKAAKLLGDDAELARGDFNDEQSLDAAMDGVERALLNSSPTPDLVESQNRFIDAAKRAGVRHIVKLSAVGARPGAPFRFGDWHGQVEKYLERSGIGWTHLRPSFFMQNFLTMAGMIKGGTIYAPAGDGKAPFVDVRNIAAVAAAALCDSGHEGKAYLVTGPAALSYGDVAAILAKVLGRAVKFVDVPRAVAVQNLVQAGMEQWQAEAINELNDQMKQGKFAEVSEVVRRVGKTEPVTLEAWVRENRAAFL
jgi:uncharacterized protein YbjT (DUF2867 family)